MRADTETPPDDKPPRDYRTARRAFIAACEKAGVDAIARLHPAKGPDGKPLFMDCAALGPRHAGKALLLLTNNAPGSALLTGMLQGGVRPSPDSRLVLVHALDPARFAGVAGDAHWPLAMLAAVATEDLSHVMALTVLNASGVDVSAALPGANIQALSVGDFAAAKAQAVAALALV